MPRTAQRQLMYGGVQNVVASAFLSTGEASQWWPATDPDFLGAEWIEFYFYLVDITGSPSAAQLQAKFQKATASTSSTEYAGPQVWQDFEDYDVAERCLGGQAWGSNIPGGTYYPRAVDHNPGTLHNSAISGSDTLGYLVNARVEKPPAKMRTVLIPTFTGGSSPAYQVVGWYEIGY